MTIDLSQVPNLEARKNAERLFLELRAAEDALSAAEENDAVAQKYVDLRAAVYATYTAAVNVLNAQEATEDGRSALQARVDAAQDAYNADDVPMIETEYDDETIVRCALSGLPIISSDDVLRNDDDEQVLRDLVLGPREADKAEAA